MKNLFALLGLASAAVPAVAENGHPALYYKALLYKLQRKEHIHRIFFFLGEKKAGEPPFLGVFFAGHFWGFAETELFRFFQNKNENECL